jgi:hypothetical protein
MVLQVSTVAGGHYQCIAASIQASWLATLAASLPSLPTLALPAFR